jgi:hypothetical protein
MREKTPDFAPLFSFCLFFHVPKAVQKFFVAPHMTFGSSCGYKNVFKGKKYQKFFILDFFDLKNI